MIAIEVKEYPFSHGEVFIQQGKAFAWTETNSGVVTGGNPIDSNGKRYYDENSIFMLWSIRENGNTELIGRYTDSAEMRKMILRLSPAWMLSILDCEKLVVSDLGGAMATLMDYLRLQDVEGVWSIKPLSTSITV